jgi:ATP-binding cassette subfamily B protein
MAATVAQHSRDDKPAGLAAAWRTALRTAVPGRCCTVLTVAYRLATAQEADRVLALEAGQSAAEGPPEALRRRGGRFAALLELESAGWNWQMDRHSCTT